MGATDVLLDPGHVLDLGASPDTLQPAEGDRRECECPLLVVEVKHLIRLFQTHLILDPKTLLAGDGESLISSM